MNNGKTSIIIYADFFEATDDWTPEEVAELWRAIHTYTQGNEPEFTSRIVRQQWRNMKTAFDRDNEKFKATCVKRSEAGKRGNELRWANKKESGEDSSQSVAKIANAITQSQSVAKIADNDNEYENDNDIKKKDIERKSDFALEDFLNAAKDPSVALPEQDAKECFDFYAAQDFLRSNGQRITSLAPLLRQWKRRRGEFTPQTRQQQGALPQNKEVAVETFRRAYDWLHNLDRMDYIPERDKAILRANLDDLRGKFKNEYNDVCTRLKDPFDELTKYIKKTGGILYA